MLLSLFPKLHFYSLPAAVRCAPWVSSCAAEPAASLELFLSARGLILLHSYQQPVPKQPSPSHTHSSLKCLHRLPSLGRIWHAINWPPRHNAYLETSGAENISWLLPGLPRIKKRGLAGFFKYGDWESEIGEQWKERGPCRGVRWWQYSHN